MTPRKLLEREDQLVDLEELLSIAQSQVKYAVKQDIESLDAVVVGVDEFDKTLVIPCPWHDENEQRAIIAFIRSVFAERNVLAYAMVTEMWVVYQDANDPTVPVPHERPDRMEVIQMMVTDGLVVKSAMYETKRDPENHIVLGRFVRHPDNHFEASALLNLIKPHSKMN